MTAIRESDLIDSVADALQYISYYHPEDYIRNLARAYEMEESPAAKDAMKQILVNSRMCFEGHRPICQDTGIVTIFLKVGMEVRFVAGRMVVRGWGGWGWGERQVLAARGPCGGGGRRHEPAGDVRCGGAAGVAES